MFENRLCSGILLKKRIAESRDHLYRVALAWCGNEMLADDLVQETIETGIKKYQQLRDEKQLRAWLHRIMNNNWYRYLRTRRMHGELDEQIPSGESGPLDDYEKYEIVNKVRKAVASLPVGQRQVISLVDLEEFSYCEVAEILDIPIGTVMSRLHRARKSLLGKMKTSVIALPERNEQHYILKQVAQ